MLVKCRPTVYSQLSLDTCHRLHILSNLADAKHTTAIAPTATNKMSPVQKQYNAFKC